MSIHAAHTATFFSELGEGLVWTIEDDGGLPTPVNSDGKRAMPFWSKESRALRLISTVEAYREFRAKSISVEEWRERWLPGITNDGFLVGLNWSGERASGFDLTPAEVLARLDAMPAA